MVFKMHNSFTEIAELTVSNNNQMVQHTKYSYRMVII